MDQVDHPLPAEHDNIDYRFISCDGDAEERKASPEESASNMKEVSAGCYPDRNK